VPRRGSAALLIFRRASIFPGCGGGKHKAVADAAARMRALRQRKQAGTRCVLVEVPEPALAGLIAAWPPR
jgi:hypothetical protein